MVRMAEVAPKLGITHRVERAYLETMALGIPLNTIRRLCIEADTAKDSSGSFLDLLAALQMEKIVMMVPLASNSVLLEIEI